MKDDKNSTQSLSGLDVMFILVASFTIVLFVLWLATTIRGDSLDFTLPAAISGLVSNLWAWLTAGAVSVLLYFLKKAPGRKLLTWTVSLSVGFILLVLGSSYLLLPKPGSFSYIVGILDKQTGVPVADAEVRIEAQELSAERATDAMGIARFDLGASFLDTAGRLIVAADGYKTLTREMNLNRTAVPNYFDLVPEVEKELLGTAAAALEKDLLESVKSGHAIVYDGNSRYEQSGYSFAKNALVSWNSGEADILVENTHSGFGLAHFFLQYDSGDEIVSGASFDNFSKSGLVSLSATSLEEVAECPISGYETFRIQPEIGGVYCVRSRDGNHFAVIKVVDVRNDRVAFDWLYQTEPSRSFR